MRTPSRIRETGLVTCGFSSSSESPQRVRGKDAHWFDQARESRITPAHAGKSRPSRRKTETKGDHPRACREKKGDRAGMQAQTGSPPRMRGKEIYKTPILLVGGITPAHAGKSCRPARRWSCPRDHPRTCGEKSFRPWHHFFPLGSPPHMRRKVFRLTLAHCSKGITPAHAGKSRRGSNPVGPGRDHPRTCGEKQQRPGRRAGIPGSHPHMRGKVITNYKTLDLLWITPAHAGKSFIRCDLPGIAVDHPRTCGEK